MNMKLVIGAIVLLPVLAHLGYGFANSTFTNYYVTVDEYVARPQAAAVRVGGTIVPGSIQWDNATRTMRFQISGDNARLDVTYRGPVPDSFRDGVTTILEGSRSAGGVFQANGVMVKCPHQYLPAS